MLDLKAKLILTSAIVLPLLGILAATAAPANACIPDDSNTTCIYPRIGLSRAPTRTTASEVALAAGATWRGDSPDHALDITGNWTTIEPGTSAWYKTPDSGSYREIEVWIDSPVQNALDLSLYSPDQQIGTWADWKPVGRGSFNKGQPEHALTWVAAYARSGVWYAVIQNHANVAVSYRFDGNVSSADTKSCHGYWEYFLNGAHVYWIDCNPQHNPQ